MRRRKGFRSATGIRTLLVNRPGVEDRLRRLLAAQHDEEVADHGGLPFLVQVHDALVRELFERHLHHPDCAFDDPLPGRDDRAGLLPLQHGRGDFLRVGQVADAGFEHLDSGLLQPLLHLFLQVLGDEAVDPRSETTCSS